MAIFNKSLEVQRALLQSLSFRICSCEKMGAPSTSQQFSALNDTFETDCAALERSIRKLKHQAAQQTPAQPIRALDEGRLASRAKDLRSMTEQVFLIFDQFLLLWIMLMSSVFHKWTLKFKAWMLKNVRNVFSRALYFTREYQVIDLGPRRLFSVNHRRAYPWILL